MHPGNFHLHFYLQSFEQQLLIRYANYVVTKRTSFSKRKNIYCIYKATEGTEVAIFYVSMNAISVESLKCNVLKAYCSLQNETKRNGTKRNENL